MLFHYVSGLPYLLVNGLIMMEELEYKYSGKTWVPFSTFSNGDCFFHALFGEKIEQDDIQFYYDRHTTFRRVCWAAFLIFIRNEEIPSPLLEALENCFHANDKFRYKSPSDVNDLDDYINSISSRKYWVLVQEIPILSTLWNVRIVLFLNDQERPLIFQPNRELSGAFPFGNVNPLKEEVIRLKDNHYERLDVVPETLIVGYDNQHLQIIDFNFESEEEPEESKYTSKKYYNKSGSAGILGSSYQIDVLTVVFFNALKKIKIWCLSTENKQAGKFDDLILETPEGDILLQAKHKESQDAIINYSSLLNTTGNYSLAKYCVSYLQLKQTFQINNVIMCTNAKLQTDKNMKGLVTQHVATNDHVLHFEQTSNIFYTFNEEIVDLLDQVVKEIKVNFTITQKDIKEFINHFQFFENFSDEGTETIIKKLIPEINLADNLSSTDTFDYVHNLITEWFKERKGRYLNHLLAKAILSDLRTIEYCKKFELKSVVFKADVLDYLEGHSKIIHIVSHQDPILNVLKLYRFLQGSKMKALFLDTSDKLIIQKQVLQAFSVSNYTYLVIVNPVISIEELTLRLCETLIKLLNTSVLKKLLLITKDKNETTELMKLKIGDCKEVDEVVRFSHLVDRTQTELKKTKGIVFQGQDMTVEELMLEDLDDFIDAQLIVALTRNDKIEIGTKIKHTDDNINSYYIDRCLNRKSENIPEELFSDLNQNTNDRIVLISDSAGMGKTTILTNLAIKIKEKYSFLWVTRIDLNSHSNTLKTAVKSKSKSIDIMDLLNGQEASKLKNDFAKKLFLKEDNVILLLDAVDEVSTSHMDLVMRMIEAAQNLKNYKKIFITTRPHLRYELEQRLKVKAFTLQPFSKDNQIDFLCKYWTQTLNLERDTEKMRCRLYAKSLINELSRWINEDSENTFAGIPLQTRMLAEVFRNKNQLDQHNSNEWEECNEFILSEKDEPLLPKKINLIQLYELFVSKKRDIFVDVKGNTGGNAITEGALKEKFEQCHEYHRSMALRIIFYADECRLFKCYKKIKVFSSIFVEEYVLRAGIVQRVDGEINFIHRTFAEYFAAQSLFLELINGKLSEEFQDFFLDEILIRDEYLVVRAFFDNFVQKSLASISDDTLITFCDIDYISILNNSKNTYLHLFAQEGAVGIMEFFIACVNFGITQEREIESDRAILINTIDLKCNTPLHDACFWGHLNIVIALVHRGADANLINANGETPLYIAAEKGHLDIVKFLVEKAGAYLNKISYYEETVMHTAARGGNLKIIEFLAQHNVTYMGAYTSALHVACYEGFLDIVKFFIGTLHADVNHLDVNNCTPLHAAAHEGHLKIVKYLVKKGSNINAVNKEGNTAFHDAACRSFMQVVIYLINKGADREIEDNEGYNIIDLYWWLKGLIERGKATDDTVGKEDNDENKKLQFQVKNNMEEESKEDSEEDSEEESSSSRSENDNKVNSDSRHRSFFEELRQVSDDTSEDIEDYETDEEWVPLELVETSFLEENCSK